MKKMHELLRGTSVLAVACERLGLTPEVVLRKAWKHAKRMGWVSKKRDPHPDEIWIVSRILEAMATPESHSIQQKKPETIEIRIDRIYRNT